MTENASPQLIKSERTYDVLKDTALYGLPAFAAAYSGLALIWGFPYGEQVVASAVVLNTLLGILIKISNKQYKESGAAYDGSLVVDATGPEKDDVHLEFDVPLEELAGKDEIRLNVDRKGFPASQ